ncbi:hypothetical protein ACTZ9G_003259 [Acinetobacter baumannii]|jgi:hypothetical protein|uniref:Uncharacterized protein n=1 Tax=Acinetobacter baumannii TaxID=470 RepID=A0A7X5RR37_ACIBA|nr:hypothetical protein [Acinetobacter baumannii]EHU1451489.1 hypothetical protein [Acinetobacter baumannii]EHU1749927.1 hypothetical protein [Acinetobacter baumannii]EHU1802516.1 hypothetical protein [Acinetobacter baumannii]EHU1953891.1 hypothetical protein [Acinetobacter baumannii]EKT9210239.1 hypothetical protein [Acinetobacter baumannii]
MSNVINLTQQAQVKFDKVKCEQLIEAVAVKALQSMNYTVAPMSQMKERLDKPLSKVA